MANHAGFHGTWWRGAAMFAQLYWLPDLPLFCPYGLMGFIKTFDLEVRDRGHWAGADTQLAGIRGGFFWILRNC